MLQPEYTLSGDPNPTSRLARFAVEAVEGQYFKFDDGSGRQTTSGLHMGYLDVTIPKDWKEWYTEENKKMVVDKIGAIVRAYNLNHGKTLTCLYNVLKSDGTPDESNDSPVSGTGRLSIMHAHMHEDGVMEWIDSDSAKLVMQELHMSAWSTGRLYTTGLLIGTSEHKGKWRYARGNDYRVDDQKQESTMPAWPLRESSRFPSTMPVLPG